MRFFKYISDIILLIGANRKMNNSVFLNVFGAKVMKLAHEFEILNLQGHIELLPEYKQHTTI